MSQLDYSSAEDYNSDEEEFQTNTNEHDRTNWHRQLAKSLLTMYDNMHVLITDFEELSQNKTMDRQQNRIKLEMMRMALILHPMDLSTWNINEINCPYSDLERLDSTESGSFEDKCYQHEKLRLRINRIISRLNRGMEKLHLILFNSLHEDKSSHYINNYRKKIEVALSEIRTQMMEYNQINRILHDDELTKHQQILKELIKEITVQNPLIEQRIEDYRMKLKPNKSIEKYEFISSPYIRLQIQNLSKIENKNYFQPLEFPNLIHQANEFFGLELSDEY